MSESIPHSPHTTVHNNNIRSETPMKMPVPSHRNLSIESRNILVVRRINKGATSKDLEKEFDRTIIALLRTLRMQHYSDTEVGRRAYDTIRARLAENDRNAVKPSSKITVSKPATESKSIAVPKPAIESKPIAVPKPATEPKTIAVPKPSTVSKSTDRSMSPATPGKPRSDAHVSPVIKPEAPVHTKTVYLVDTGIMLNVPFEKLLELDEGKAIFYMPHFCLAELHTMSRDDIRAERALNKAYSDDVFKKRFFSLSNNYSEQTVVAYTAEMLNSKPRSRSFVNAAVSFALLADEGTLVKVLTNSREISNIMREVIKTEGIEHLLKVVSIFYRAT